MNRNDLLYNLYNAIAYRGWISQSHKLIKNTKAKNHVVAMWPASYRLDQIERNADAVDRGETGAMEYFLEQILADYEFDAGRSLGTKIHRTFSNICAKQKPNRGNRKTLPYIEDEYLYQLMTCKIVLEAGVGFFKIETIDEETKEKNTYKIVSKSKNDDSLEWDETTVAGALAKLLGRKEDTIDKALQKYNKKLKEKEIILLDKAEAIVGEKDKVFTKRYDRADKAFTDKLRKFFFESCNEDGTPSKYTCKEAGITEFIFIQKEVTPTPQGILTYLLENIIKPQPRIIHYFGCKPEDINKSC